MRKMLDDVEPPDDTLDAINKIIEKDSQSSHLYLNQNQYLPCILHALRYVFLA